MFSYCGYMGIKYSIFLIYLQIKKLYQMTIFLCNLNKTYDIRDLFDINSYPR